MEKYQTELLKNLDKLKKEGVISNEEYGHQKELIVGVKPEHKSRGMFQCYKDCFTKYFDFKGRSGRFEYCSFLIFNLLAGIVLRACFPQALHRLYVLAAVIPGWAVAVRRLHDTNKSGWKLLVPIGLFAGLWLAGLTAGFISNHFYSGEAWFDKIKKNIYVLSFIIGLVGMSVQYFWWILKKGDAFCNRYGEAPNELEEKRYGVIVFGLLVMLLSPVVGIVQAASGLKAMNALRPPARKAGYHQVVSPIKKQPYAVGKVKTKSIKPRPTLPIVTDPRRKL